LPHAGGDFTPSPPPALLGELTDHTLVVASDALEAAITGVQPKPSGRARLRLLAWLVADARGATVPLDKALAETVGKRLEKQAQKVRDDCAAASERAAEQRYDARSDASAASLPARLAAIDEQERLALKRPFAEVYVGFHELEGLLPSSDGGDPDAASFAAPSAAPAAAPDAAPATVAPATAPAAEHTTAPASSVPASSAAESTAERYDLACELHKELVATRAELHRTREELRSTQEDLGWEQQHLIFAKGAMRMMQRALSSCAGELEDARKRLRDPDEDEGYFKALFATHSFVDEDQWLGLRKRVRREWDEREAEQPTEVYQDLAKESWDQLVDRSLDPIRRFV
jgi:chemotaxis protein histidine kinase CheA